MKEGGKPRDEERRKAGKGKEEKKESHEGFDTQVPNISRILKKKIERMWKKKKGREQNKNCLRE